uniref:L-serine deaminase n=1 Tax=Saccoglossus kowalevskii TaxID=10224 RepID=A0ABM0M995_SACKO|nr:PREDICTED: serine racemase-like [Saccoglossus kowalevskii]
MYDPDAPLVTLNDILSAREFQKSSELCIHTPMIHHVQDRVGIPPSIDLHLKLETMQKTGSFKPRGIINQLRYIPDKVLSGEQTMVTLSAGNYGKAFAVATQIKKLKALVIMASSAPDNRETVIKSYGAQVERYPTPELVSAVDRSVAERGMIFMHSFDDAALIAGHGSLGLEIMEDVSDPDVVVVCCGGGGLIAGTAAAIKLSGKTSTRIYGVEPEGGKYEQIEITEASF